jgi:hypothetical protein
MATKVKRTSVRISDFARYAQSYLFNRYQASVASKPQEAAKKWLKPWLLEHGTVTSEGHTRRLFPTPMVIGSTTYYGLELRKVKPEQYFETEEVRELVRTLRPADAKRVIYSVTVEKIDTDELYVLQAEGKISEAQLRELIHEKEQTPQLWPVEEDPCTDL